MLRTNNLLLAYIEELYKNQQRKEDIILKSYSKGDKLFYQDEKANKVMVIKEGVTKCYFTENNDREYVVEFLGKGEILGEVEFIRKINCLCNIETLTEVKVLALSYSFFQSLLDTNLNLNNLLLNVFAERIVNTSSRASFQQLYTVEYTLDKLLEMQSKQNIELSKEDMASYLGISVRSLNRNLKK